MYVAKSPTRPQQPQPKTPKALNSPNCNIMGKCRVCLALKREAPKQASMYGKDEQSGRMMRIRCSEHKEALDVTRTVWEQSEDYSQRDARKRPKLGNQMRLPIDLESLPDKPAIVVSMKPDWLADQMGELTFTQVVEGSNIRWMADTKKVLDLTSQQPDRCCRYAAAAAAAAGATAARRLWSRCCCRGRHSHGRGRRCHRRRSGHRGHHNRRHCCSSRRSGPPQQAPPIKPTIISIIILLSIHFIKNTT